MITGYGLLARPLLHPLRVRAPHAEYVDCIEPTVADKVWCVMCVRLLGCLTLASRCL